MDKGMLTTAYGELHQVGENLRLFLVRRGCFAAKSEQIPEAIACRLHNIHKELCDAKLDIEILIREPNHGVPGL